MDELKHALMNHIWLLAEERRQHSKMSSQLERLTQGYSSFALHLFGKPKCIENLLLHEMKTQEPFWASDFINVMYYILTYLVSFESD